MQLLLDVLEVEQLGLLYGSAGGEEKLLEAEDVMGLLMTLW